MPLWKADGKLTKTVSSLCKRILNVLFTYWLQKKQRLSVGTIALSIRRSTIPTKNNSFGSPPMFKHMCLGGCCKGGDGKLLFFCGKPWNTCWKTVIFLWKTVDFVQTNYACHVFGHELYGFPIFTHSFRNGIPRCSVGCSRFSRRWRLHARKHSNTYLTYGE